MDRYRELQRWLERERRRIERAGARKSQRYLRRARLVDDTDPISLRELIRELQAMPTTKPRKAATRTAR